MNANSPGSSPDVQPAIDSWQLILLDGFRLRPGVAEPRDDASPHGRREHSITGRGQRLVALLTLLGPQLRTYIAGMMWPEVAEDRARASVRATICDLHRQVPGLVRSTPHEARLADGVAVDVSRFVELARAAIRLQPGDDIPDEAMDLVPGGRFGGALLPGWYDDWVVVEAERLHQLRLHAMDVLVQRLVEAARYPAALEVAQATVSADPLRESANRALMRVHLAEGNTAEALRQFERFRLALRAAMDIEPSRRMLDLVAQIRSARHLEPFEPLRVNG